LFLTRKSAAAETKINKNHKKEQKDEKDEKRVHQFGTFYLQTL
jgi:hypothetical protein